MFKNPKNFYFSNWQMYMEIGNCETKIITCVRCEDRFIRYRSTDTLIFCTNKNRARKILKYNSLSVNEIQNKKNIRFEYKHFFIKTIFDI